MDDSQREALVGLGRIGFAEIFRDETRIIVRHEKHDLTVPIPWTDLSWAMVRMLRDKLRAGIPTQRSAPAAESKRPVRDRIAEERLAKARERRERAASQWQAADRAYQKFQFYDRLMRSRPGRGAAWSDT